MEELKKEPRQEPGGKLHGALTLSLTFSYLTQSKPTVGGPHPAHELTIKNMPHEPIS